MGKQRRARQQAAQAGQTSASAAPRLLFGIGDADLGYSENKILRLADRMRQHGEWQVRIASHDADVEAQAKKLGLATQMVAIESPGVTVNDRLQATDAMIRETADIDIPGSSLPLWKVLAMDDFLGSMQLFGAQPRDTIDADLLVVPLMAVDNNTRAACGLYTWLVAEAKRKGIPTVALEVSPLGNKFTFSHLPADHFAVKSAWSREFLLREGLARPDQVSILRWEEGYCLWPGKDDYTEAYIEHEAKMRGILGVAPDDFIVLIPHHVSFLWESRQILAALAELDWPITVVIRVEARTSRRQYAEREIVLQSYGKELARLPRVVIDEQVGVGLLLQLADVIIAPFAGTTTERAALCHKPTIICQALGQEGAQGDSIYWEPRPEKIVQLLRAWRSDGRLPRPRLARRLLELVKPNALAA